jgi:hypothetical protein
VKGKVLDVQPDALRLRVNETSNPSVHRRGEAMIPAQSVSAMKVTGNGKKWRIICTLAAPFVLAGGLATFAGNLPDSGAEGGDIIGASVWAFIAGGFFLGRFLDRRATEIEVAHGGPSADGSALRQ